MPGRSAVNALSLALALAALTVAAALLADGARASSYSCPSLTGDVSFAGSPAEVNKVKVGYKKSPEKVHIDDRGDQSDGNTCTKTVPFTELTVALNDLDDSVRLDAKGLGGSWKGLAKGISARMVGLTGHDKLRGHDGPDDAEGGEGKDTITTLGGADEIDGGGGKDLIRSGPGGDTINATDYARPDEVHCGPGDDTVLAEKADDVADDCEDIDLP